MTTPLSFEFDGTIEELVKYLSAVFRDDGAQLRVHARVFLPPPRQPDWLKRLSSYGTLPAGIPASAFEPVFNELAAGRKIGAIKELRTVTSWDLRSSKEAVEQLLLPSLASRLVAGSTEGGQDMRLTAIVDGKEFSLED